MIKNTAIALLFALPFFALSGAANAADSLTDTLAQDDAKLTADENAPDAGTVEGEMQIQLDMQNEALIGEEAQEAVTTEVNVNEGIESEMKVE